MSANQTIGESFVDNLIFDARIPIDIKTVTLAGGAGTLKRGTVVSIAAPDEAGTAWAGAEGDKADCILCDDVDTGNDSDVTVIGHAYRSGHFCRNNLVFGGDAVAITPTAEKQLRDSGIFLSNSVS